MQINNVVELCTLFQFNAKEMDVVRGSAVPTIEVLDLLKRKGVIHPNNLLHLQDAFTKLCLNSAVTLVKKYVEATQGEDGNDINTLTKTKFANYYFFE